MKTFKEFVAETSSQLTESFVSLLPHHSKEREKHADEVFHMVHKSYEPVGGISGTGFKSPEDMKKNIPMWKLHRKNGKIHAAALYKDKGGRKLVALATDGSPEGKHGLRNMMVNDMTQHRAHTEVSGKPLHMLKKHVPELAKYAIPVEHVKASMPHDEFRPVEDHDQEVLDHPELKHHFYQRKIGNHFHTKIALGSMGHHIT